MKASILQPICQLQQVQFNTLCLLLTQQLLSSMHTIQLVVVDTFLCIVWRLGLL
jgi:hypothetical protein